MHAAVGRMAEVKVLAREAAPLLADQGVNAEARRALALFCHGAEEERLTTAILRRIIDHLDCARHDPHLQFDAAV